MPSCRPDVIPAIVYKIIEMKPTTIVDVGAGCGKWGVLCREYLKYWCNINPLITGIEAFKGYKNPAHDIYNKFIYGDVLDYLTEVQNVDLVLCIDVIEHMTKEQGRQFMDAISGNYIICTPNYWHAQGESFGNRYEKHVSLWKPEDFENAVVVANRYIVGWR